MYVVDLVLTEEHIKLLNEVNLLGNLVRCSKPYVISCVSRYLENPEADKEVVEMLREVYEKKLNLYSNLENDEIVKSIEDISNLHYDNIHYGLTTEELEAIQTKLESVLNIEERNPYIEPINANNIKELVNALKLIAKNSGDRRYKELAYILSSTSSLFKDAKNSSAKGTVFKVLNARQDEFEIILKGIKFLIKMKSLGNTPASWRTF